MSRDFEGNVCLEVLLFHCGNHPLKQGTWDRKQVELHNSSLHSTYVSTICVRYSILMEWWYPLHHNLIICLIYLPIRRRRESEILDVLNFYFHYNMVRCLNEENLKDFFRDRDTTWIIPSGSLYHKVTRTQTLRRRSSKRTTIITKHIVLWPPLTTPPSASLYLNKNSEYLPNICKLSTSSLFF